MSICHHDDIKLHELIPLDLEQTIRLWDIPRLRVKSENLPENANPIITFIMLASNGDWHAGVKWATERFTGTHMTSIVKCSTLQELTNQLPKYFELK